MRSVAVILTAAVLLLTGCDYEEVEREIGYKGKARVNPWLAAERFASAKGRAIKSTISWTPPSAAEAMWVVPASVLGNQSFIRRMEDWVMEGGHLLVLLEHAEAEESDWSSHWVEPILQPALKRFLGETGLVVEEDMNTARTKTERISFGGDEFKVSADSQIRVTEPDGKPGAFASVEYGAGRVSVLADSRLLRNRWISDQDHAALLDALIEDSSGPGAIGFMRGSGLSLWALLSNHLAPVLLGMAVVLCLWLWKNLARFGPPESAATAAPLRGYEHHLEALGDYQWRLDRAASLIAPLRTQIVELGQAASLRAGRRDDDFLQFLAERAKLPRERVHRALVEPAPADAAILTRSVADLQELLKVLQSTRRS